MYRRFTSVECIVMVLNELEPCVLNDKLRNVTSEVIAYFIEHCRGIDDTSAVERYHLHMDITIIDFGSILTSLRETKCTQLSFMYMQVGRMFFTPLEII